MAAWCAGRCSRRWPRWRLLIMALMARGPREPAVAGVRRAGSCDRAIADDADRMRTVEAAWAIVDDLVGPIDVETRASGHRRRRPASAERAALHLSGAEQVELVRLLGQELTRAGGGI